jgi:uncharacterized Tic20 family protein
MKTIKSFFVLFLTGIILSGCMAGRPGMGGMPVTWNGAYFWGIMFLLVVMFVFVLLRSLNNSNRNDSYLYPQDAWQQILTKLENLESEIKEIKKILENRH